MSHIPDTQCGRVFRFRSALYGIDTNDDVHSSRCEECGACSPATSSPLLGGPLERQSAEADHLVGGSKINLGNSDISQLG